MEKQALKILELLTAGTVFERWKFTVRLEILSPNTLAEISPEWDLQRAKIALSPEWEQYGIMSLEELLRHELGHCLTHDVFEVITGLLSDNPQAVTALEDQLATRAGQMFPLIPGARDENAV